MVMPASSHGWLPDEVRALPEDGKRYEVIDGALLVTPAPSWSHQAAAAQLWLRLLRYVSESRLGSVIMSPADVELQRDNLVQPDVFVVPPVDGRPARAWDEVRRLLLVVEVSSPSSARTDRQLKRRLYQGAGVPEYWVVDVDARLIERWRPGDDRPEVLCDQIVWRPDEAYPVLTVDLAEYFTAVDPQ